MKDNVSIRGGVHSDRIHDSAVKHVTGAAEYTDDIAEPKGTLHAYLGVSDVAHARIRSVDLSAVTAAPGVIGVLTPADVPGVNDISPTGLNDEPVFPTELIRFHGQPLFAVIAETRDAARRAVELAKVDCEVLAHALDPIAAQEAGYPHVTAPLKLERGAVGPAFEAATRRIAGRMTVGGQDQMYLEGHIAFAIPDKDDDVIVHCLTQHPSEAQHMMAHVLGVPSNAVTVNVRRMGGGFGGKESQMNLFCAVATIGAKKWNRAVKIRPDRDLDLTATGKRHDFVIDYDVAFDDEGRIEAVDGIFAARCGFSSDLSGPVTDRALFHADNAYFYPNVRLESRPIKTNTVSNTAFRGFGSPFPTTAYIGHPAYSRMGAHAGYLIGVGIVIPVAAFFGLRAFLNNLIPVAAAAPVLVFVALSLVTNTAHSVKTDHMAAVTIAMMPHVSSFLIIKWGSLIGALGAVGVAGLPQLGDPALTAALLQQGAHFEGHLALSQGAILTGLIWGAIVASVIDGDFRNAGGFALAAALMSLVGIIHSSCLHWPDFSGVSMGYLIAAVFLFIYPLFHKTGELENRNLPTDEPQPVLGE